MRWRAGASAHVSGRPQFALERASGETHQKRRRDCATYGELDTNAQLREREH